MVGGIAAAAAAAADGRQLDGVVLVGREDRVFVSDAHRRLVLDRSGPRRDRSGPLLLARENPVVLLLAPNFEVLVAWQCRKKLRYQRTEDCSYIKNTRLEPLV